MREVGRGAASGHTVGGSAGGSAYGTDVGTAAATAAAAADRPADNQFHLGVQATLVDDVVDLVGTLVVQAAAIPLEDLVTCAVDRSMDERWMNGM